MSKKILKRSLALGALMAFVITGSAMAGNVPSRNIVAKGEYKEITCNLNGIPDSYLNWYSEYVVGGYHNEGVADASKILNSDIKVVGGEFHSVIGGNLTKEVKTEEGQSPCNVSAASTNIVVDGANVKVKQLIGGTAFVSYDGSDNANGRTTNVTILSGVFGSEIDNGNCPEMHVVGGDLIKSSSGSSVSTNHTNITLVDNTNVKIAGGTFDAAIYGGSAVMRNYSSYGGGELTSTVNNSNIEITGGTFNDAIVAGGMAWGHKTESKVGNATINITGGTFKDGADIFAGGMDGSLTNNITTAVSQVTGKTKININNVVVQNIYGTGGIIENINKGNKQYDWLYRQDTNSDAIVNTTLKLTNVTADNVGIPLGSVTLRVEDTADTKGQINIGQGAEELTGLTVTDTGDNKVAVSVEANGEVNDAYAGDYKKMVEERFKVKGYELLKSEEGSEEETFNVDAMTIEAGEVMGAATLNSDGTITVEANESNAGISDISSVGLMAWRAETNDMNKRLGELRNANGEHGVWVRMVRGESEYNSVKNQYNQYQLGYDEKLSVDKSWTVGMALSYTDAESSFSQGSGENTHKGLAIYGSKLNADGSFVDLIAKYSRLEHDFDLGEYKGDYDTNGYSVSAEYGKRFQQGNGMWIEPQVELTYGQVDGATYMVGGRTVNQDNMESLIGRVGFSLGKDIKQGNVYARASYLYDFEGETSATYTKGKAKSSFEQDLGGGWWEVGVGANINLSKATYIYADVEKTFGGEVDTNWQWNLGVRYSF